MSATLLLKLIIVIGILLFWPRFRRWYRRIRMERYWLSKTAYAQQLSRDQLVATDVTHFDQLLNDHLTAHELRHQPLSEAESLISALYAVDGEVNNGGFEQLFFNSTRVEVPRALKALVAIGAAEHEAVLSATLKRYDESRRRFQRQRKKVDARLAGQDLNELDPVTHKKAWQDFTELSDDRAFEQLNARWYKLESQQLAAKIRTYILNHIGEFTHEGIE